MVLFAVSQNDCLSLCYIFRLPRLTYSTRQYCEFCKQLSSIRGTSYFSRLVSPLTKIVSQQLVDLKTFAILGANGPFRNSSFNEFFNPTSTQPPFFQIFDPAFLDILGPNPSFTEIASNDTFPFAHEAPIYVADTDEFFFASNDGGLPGVADLNHNNFVGKISMKAVEEALQEAKKSNHGGKISVNVPVTEASFCYFSIV